MCPKGKKNRFLKKIMSSHFFAEFFFNSNLCLGKHQLLHCNIFYIYKYTVKYVLGEILK